MNKYKINSINRFKSNIKFWSDFYILINNLILKKISKNEFKDYDIYITNKMSYEVVIEVNVTHTSNKKINFIEGFYLGYKYIIHFKK